MWCIVMTVLYCAFPVNYLSMSHYHRLLKVNK